MSSTAHQQLPLICISTLICIWSSWVGCSSSCLPLYGIRITSIGKVEKVLDGVRCQSVDLPSVIHFLLVDIKPHLQAQQPLSLDLEIIDSSITAIDDGLLAGLRIRRLLVRGSGLRSVGAHCFSAQENVLEELDLSDNQLTDIPVAVRNLTLLRRLNLSRNRISTLPDATVFFHLLRLTHLNLNDNRLGYLDSIGRERYGGGEYLPLGIFNVEPLRQHLRVLLLRNNNLTAFPRQFSRPFDQLRHLDLADNRLLSMPADAFSLMPQLRELHLEMNRLARVGPLQLPQSLQSLFLRGNPLHCDCSANWLWRLVHNTSSGLELDLPQCQRPQHLHRWRLDQLPADFCRRHDPPDSTWNRQEGNVRVDVQSKSHSVSIGIRRLAYPSNSSANQSFRKETFDWEISKRRFGDDRTDRVSGTAHGRSIDLDDVIDDLRPSTAYHVCVNVSGDRLQEHYRCLEVLTAGPEHEPYPVTEIAVAAGVSTSTTLAVVLLVCCCCPATNCKKKKKKKKPNQEDHEADEEEPIQRKPPQPAQPPQSVFIKELESNKTFRDTCEYLRQRPPALTTRTPRAAKTSEWRTKRRGYAATWTAGVTYRRYRYHVPRISAPVYAVATLRRVPRQKTDRRFDWSTAAVPVSM